MATKKAPAKKAPAKKTTAKKTVAKKTIPIRSKDGKSLAGSVSLEGKKAPEAKKTTKVSVKKIAAVKPVKKLLQKDIYQIELEADMKKFNVSEEVILSARDWLDIYLQDIIPDVKDFVPTLSVKKDIFKAKNDSFKVDIYKGKVKIGSAKSNGYYANNDLDFTFLSDEDEAIWKEEVATGYESTWYSKDSNYIGYLNSLSYPVKMEEFIEEAKKEFGLPD